MRWLFLWPCAWREASSDGRLSKQDYNGECESLMHECRFPDCRFFLICAIHGKLTTGIRTWCPCTYRIQKPVGHIFRNLHGVLGSSSIHSLQWSGDELPKMSLSHKHFGKSDVGCLRQCCASQYLGPRYRYYQFDAALLAPITKAWLIDIVIMNWSWRICIE